MRSARAPGRFCMVFAPENKEQDSSEYDNMLGKRIQISTQQMTRQIVIRLYFT